MAGQRILYVILKMSAVFRSQLNAPGWLDGKSNLIVAIQVWGLQETHIASEVEARSVAQLWTNLWGVNIIHLSTGLLTGV